MRLLDTEAGGEPVIMVKCDRCGAIEPAQTFNGYSFNIPEGWNRVAPDPILALRGAIEKHYCRACAGRIGSRTEASA